MSSCTAERRRLPSVVLLALLLASWVGVGIVAGASDTLVAAFAAIHVGSPQQSSIVTASDYDATPATAHSSERTEARTGEDPRSAPPRSVPSATGSYDACIHHYDDTASSRFARRASDGAIAGDATAVGAARELDDDQLNATEAVDTTRVGRWMGQGEYDAMTSSGKVVEGAGGRTFVVEPPNPAAYPSAKPCSVFAEFDVPTASLKPAGKPEWSVIPGPNAGTTRFGPLPSEMPSATNVCLVCRK